jgi:hypothetical protein
LIFSKDPAEHRKHVTQMLEKLRLAGLQANIKKSEFSVIKTKFIGYIISINGIAVDPDKVLAITNYVGKTLA